MEEADPLNLQIVVNDEVIDLRKESFDQTTTPNKIRPTIKNSFQKLELSEERQKQVYGLKKLASTLYNIPATSAMLQKHRNTLLNRQKIRATSADPRFRRERSPLIESHANQSRSESLVGSSIDRSQSESRKVSQSAHLMNPKNEYKKVESLKSAGRCDNLYYLESSQNMLKAEHPKQSQVMACNKKETESQSSLCSCCENCNEPKANCTKYVEQSTMTEGLEYCEIYNSHKVCWSTYESAKSDTGQELKSLDTLTYPNDTAMLPVLSSDQTICEHISPYWDDPRLVEKYSNYIKPIPIKHVKSSWTLPFSNEKQSIISSFDNSFSVGDGNGILQTYKYDNQSDAESSLIISRGGRFSILASLLNTKLNFTPFFLLGSLCGLALVTLVGWMFSNDFLWSFFHPVKKEEKFYVHIFSFVCGGILKTLEHLFKTVSYLLVVPRRDFLMPRDDDINRIKR